MIRLKSSVDRWKLKWKGIPRGRDGVANVEVSDSAKTGDAVDFTGEVRWRRDSDGIWIQLPHGVFGFDLRAEKDDSGRPVYSVSQRIHHSAWAGITASQGDDSQQMSSRTGKAKAVRVRAQMPGKIIRVLAQADQIVQKDQPIIVMEAMKMENEIRASQTGRVTQVKVVEGQTVETGADLLLIDCSGE